MNNDEIKTVPLVTYESGERKVIGEAQIEDLAGHPVIFVGEIDVNSELAMNIKETIQPGSFSIAEDSRRVPLFDYVTAEHKTTDLDDNPVIRRRQELLYRHIHGLSPKIEE